MKIGVLGTGPVGNAVAGRLMGLGHDVTMGSRTADNEKLAEWMAATGGAGGTFADAARGAELVVLATSGTVAVDVLTAAQPADGTVVLDISNPLDFGRGFPPANFTGPWDSIGERLQTAFPTLKVVKSLNTVNNQLMVYPANLPGPHTMLVAGDDAAAKQAVTELLTTFGWTDILDLGGITGARGMEAYVLLWVQLYGAVGGHDFNIHVVRN